jgi:integrase/recombinase XerC
VRDNRVWIAFWVSTMAAAGAATGTIKVRRTHLERLASALHLPTCSEDDLVMWLHAHAAALKPNSRKSMISSIRAFYGWAQRTGRRTDNPAAGLAPVRVPPGIPRPVPEKVLRVALEQADEETTLMLLLGGYAGLRRAEIARVHSDDVTDLGLAVRGKGGRMRLVPIHPLLAPRLAGLDHGWAFPSPVRPGQPVSPDYIEDRITRVLPPPHTVHTLRHRFATRAYAGSHDIRVVQRLLGHSSIATTQIYVQVDDDALRDAVLAIA